jgi:hypothetical protein
MSRIDSFVDRSLPSRASFSRHAVLRSLPGGAKPSKVTSFIFLQDFVGEQSSSTENSAEVSDVQSDFNTVLASSDLLLILLLQYESLRLNYNELNALASLGDF